MSRTPLATIIVPVFNGESFLGAALESALAQDVGNVEVIVVDDGSQDGTAGIARSFPRVRYLWQENAGPGAARNAGLAVAQGEFVAFLDADDVIPPDKLSLQIGYLRDHPEVGCVLGKHEWISDGAGPPDLERDALYDEVGGIPLMTLVTRRTVLDELGGFDSAFRISEDRDLLIRMRERGIHIVVLPQVVLHRRWHDASTTVNRTVPTLMARSLKAKLDRARAAAKEDSP